MNRKRSVSTQEIMYRSYVMSLGKEMLEVVNRVPPEIGQVRLVMFTPPEWLVVVGQPSKDLFTAVPLTTLIPLAITDRYPPVVEWKHYRLVPLPFWVYIRREILERYSKPVFKIRDTEAIKKYAKEARTTAIGKWREKFIQKVADRFADINLSSLLYSVSVSEARAESIVVQFPKELAEELKSREGLALAAKPLSCARGDVWLAIVEQGKLVLYLDEDYTGKKVRISLGDRTLFEGEGKRKIVFEGFPELNSYNFLEEELDVQVLGD
jgi:hypothetical protein